MKKRQFWKIINFPGVEKVTLKIKNLLINFLNVLVFDIFFSALTLVASASGIPLQKIYSELLTEWLTRSPISKQNVAFITSCFDKAQCAQVMLAIASRLAHDEKLQIEVRSFFC